MAFDWEHNLGHHKTYIGDQTLYAYFEDGFTVTFNSNGGRLKAEDPDVREIDTTDYEDNLFFDIGECIPVREGYKFEGWCTSPSADANSLIQDTENSKWIEDWFEERMYDTDINKYDIQLYAKWKKEDPCAKGHKLQEIVTQETTNSNGKNRQNRQMAIRYSTVLLLNLKVQRISSYQRTKERVKRFQNLKQRKSII